MLDLKLTDYLIEIYSRMLCHMYNKNIFNYPDISNGLPYFFKHFYILLLIFSVYEYTRYITFNSTVIIMNIYP